MNLQEKIIDGLQLPKDVLLGAAILTLTDNQMARIENVRGILSCEKELIRIMSKRHRIEIQGENLVLHEYTNDEIVITGKIESVQYVSREV